MQNRQLDGDSTCRRDERRTPTRSRFDDGLDRIGRIGAIYSYCVCDPREAALDFVIRISTSRFDVTGNFSLQPADLHIRYGGTLYAPYLMAHHDPTKEIAQWRRSGVVPTGLVTFVGNKIVPFHHGAELQSMKRFGLDRGDRALGLALFACPALGELTCG